MATKPQKGAKPTKTVKPAPAAKKSAPVKKAVANKVVKKTPAKAVPVKKAAVKKVAPKPVAKKSAPVKKAAPVKKVVPAKKAASSKKVETKHNPKTVNKKDSKTTAKKAVAPAKKTPAPPAKKVVAPAKKAVAASKPATKKAPETKKPAPAAKTAKKPEPAKKAAPAKPAAPVKKAAPAPVAKPVAKAKVEPVKAAPAPPPAAPKKAKVGGKTPSKKIVTTAKGVTFKVPSSNAVRPTATPAVRTIEKKPNVIIAHRRLADKATKPTEAGKTMVTYQPDTYRSILDEPKDQTGPVYRYSDEELTEFREIIVQRLDAARKELNYLQGLITRKDEAGTEDTENRYMNMEDGSGAMEREQLAQLASRQIQFMGNLEKAMVRIENKTYGICRVTGKLIDKARLRAVPHATLSIEAKKQMAGKPQQQ